MACNIINTNVRNLVVFTWVAIVSEMARHNTGTSEPLDEDQVLLPVDVDDARYQ